MKSPERSFGNIKLILLCVMIMLLAGSILAYAMVNNVLIRNTGELTPLVEVTASSGSAADIQVAVDEVAAVAERGTVHIPAGSFNFVNVGEAWRTVNVPAGVNILGAPTEKDSAGQVVQWETVLIMPHDVPGDWYDIPVWFQIGNGEQDPAKPSRFSDIKLQGYRSIDPTSETIHRGISLNGVMNFRIDHCMFEHIAGGAVHMSPFAGNFLCNGVIDHCGFVNIYGVSDLANYMNGNVGYGVRVARAFNPPDPTVPFPFDATMDVLGKYTDYTVFIEDCYFSKWRHCVSSSHGGYYVFRHNIVDLDFGHFSLDVHGLRDFGNAAGGRGVEIYENVFRNIDWPTGPKSPLQNGGGCGVFFNNFVDNTHLSNIALYTEDGVTSDVWHLQDFYMWGNKGTWTPPNWEGVHPNFTPDRNVEAYWNRTAGNEGDPNYPNVDPSWSIAGYTPYPYPHPLTIE